MERAIDVDGSWTERENSILIQLSGLISTPGRVAAITIEAGGERVRITPNEAVTCLSGH